MYCDMKIKNGLMNEWVDRGLLNELMTFYKAGQKL